MRHFSEEPAYQTPPDEIRQIIEAAQMKTVKNYEPLCAHCGDQGGAVIEGKWRACRKCPKKHNPVKSRNGMKLRKVEGLKDGK